MKKIAKPILIGAAIYLTGGLALSAFPATAGFAASLPGFGISASGAATGIFSKAASAIGLSGGLQAGAAANAAAAGVTAGVGAGAAVAGSTGASAVSAGVTAAGAAGPTAAGMTLTEKLLLASMGTQAVGSFLAPSTDEVYEAQRKWRGAFYGVEGDGGTNRPGSEPQAPAQPGKQLMQATTPRDQTVAPPKGPATPEPIAPPEPGAPAAQGTMPGASVAPKRQLMGGEEPIENDPIALTKPNAKGVRYLT